MKTRTSILALVFIWLLAACSGAQPDQPPVSQSDGPVITVYRAPT